MVNLSQSDRLDCHATAWLAMTGERGRVDCYVALLSTRTKGESGVRALGESLLDDVRKMRYF